MPPIRESAERPQNNVDVSREAEQRIKGLETLIGMMKKSAPIQAQDDIPELNSAKWDLKSVIVVKDYYFVLSNDGRDMQVLLIDAQGEMSVDETVPPPIKKAATLKIHAMRGTTPEPTMPSRPPVRSVPSPSRAPAPAPSARRETPAPAPTRVSEARTDVVPTGDASIDAVFDAFKGLSLSVKGENIPVTLDIRFSTAAGIASYLRKNNVPIARYESYLLTMNDQKNLLEKVLSRKSGRYAVEWRGDHFEAKAERYPIITTTATDVFETDATTNVEKSLITDRTLSRIARSTGMEYSYSDGTREYHRTDGLQYREKADGTRQFFDGSNKQPVMEKTGTGVNVFGPDGDKVNATRRPTESNVKSYADNLAKKLKTPEAIAAFVSQFYLSHEYKTSPDNARWLREAHSGVNPVKYEGETGNRQDVQRWDDTLIKGSGDCEDYALLAQELLERAGVKSFCMKVSIAHYEAVYFEPAGVDERGQKQFHVCNLGLSGFKRSVQTFSSLPEAARSLAIGSVASDGVHVLEMPKNRVDSDSEEGVIPLSGSQAEGYYKYFVRK